MRLSDKTVHHFPDIGPNTFVKSLKELIKTDFPPAYPNGCRLVYEGRVLSSKHRLKHYRVSEKDIIQMDDRKDWTDTSSESDS